MYYFYRSIYFFLLFSNISTSQPSIKSATLTPQTKQTMGAVIYSHFGEVSIANNLWNVDINSQTSWQFIIVLDASWGFHPTADSFIEFTINSPSITTGSGNFNDIVFGLTADNQQYFSISTPMNSPSSSNRIYPFCDTSISPSQTFANGDVAQLPQFDRNCDVAGGSCSNWRSMLPQNTISNEFPITFKLQNSPSTNTFFVSLSSTKSTTIQQQCGFVPFVAEKGLKIYIGGNDPGQSFEISSVDIVSYIGTDSPTPNPTSSTNPPTMTPSMAPSFSPTKAPTPSPTSDPTIAPTMSPSMAPSLAPSSSPSNTPSAPPTNIPS